MDIAKIAGRPRIPGLPICRLYNLRIFGSLPVLKRQLAQQWPTKQTSLVCMAAIWMNDLRLSLQHMQGRRDAFLTSLQLVLTELRTLPNMPADLLRIAC